MTFNFYALTESTAAPDVLRLPLLADIQRQLSQKFEDLTSSFVPDGVQEIDYDPRYRPDAGEVFRLTAFDLPDALRRLAPAPPALEPLSDEMLEAGHVRAIVAVGQAARFEDARFVFQRVDLNQVIRRSTFSLLLDHQVFTRSDASGLVVAPRVDAVFQSGTLYFHSEYATRRFLDLRTSFEEATDAAVAEFVAAGCFAPFKNGGLPADDQWVRRKIASILASGLLDKLNAGRAASLAKKFGVTIRTAKKGAATLLVLPDDKREFKAALRFLDEDYMQSELSSTKFQVNSKRALT